MSVPDFSNWIFTARPSCNILFQKMGRINWKGGGGEDNSICVSPWKISENICGQKSCWHAWMLRVKEKKNKHLTRLYVIYQRCYLGLSDFQIPSIVVTINTIFKYLIMITYIPALLTQFLNGNNILHVAYFLLSCSFALRTV